MFKRIILIVMDSVGIGYGIDAERFNDEGSNTLGHIEQQGIILCDTLKQLGLAEIADVKSIDTPVRGFYGRMNEMSAGKDTTSGHWEMMGHPIMNPFPTFPNAFSKNVMDKLEKETGYEFLGNEVASGTEIIARLGQEHIESKKPIIYTSADSVMQIAAHEDVISVPELYRICEIARTKICVGELEVGRVIARPFVGKPGKFVRTTNRHDFSRKPIHKMYQEILQENDYQTIAVGKIGDIYAKVGWDESYPTKSNAHGMMKIAELLGSKFKKGLLMANLVEFDSKYGHRRNVDGYRRCIEEFDGLLKGLLPLLREDDLLIITADHGNDPTWRGTDHTREKVPVLGYYKDLDTAINIGERDCFADLGQTILDNFNCPLGQYGDSFLKEIKNF